MDILIIDLLFRISIMSKWPTHHWISQIYQKEQMFITAKGPSECCIMLAVFHIAVFLADFIYYYFSLVIQDLSISMSSTSDLTTG